MRSALLTVILWPSLLWAHAVGMDVRTVGEEIRVEAYYDDDTPAAAAKVKLLRGDDVIWEGLTDERGVCVFPLPQPGSYKVLLNAGDGHAVTRTLTITETGPAPLNNSLSRDEFIRTPWARIGLGLGVIAILTLLTRLFRRKPHATSATHRVYPD